MLPRLLWCCWCGDGRPDDQRARRLQRAPAPGKDLLARLGREGELALPGRAEHLDADDRAGAAQESAAVVLLWLELGQLKEALIKLVEREPAVACQDQADQACHAGALAD